MSDEDRLTLLTDIDSSGPFTDDAVEAATCFSQVDSGS